MFKSQSDRILGNVVVHVQCTKLFKGMECIRLPMVGLLCNIKNPYIHSK